MLLFLILCSVYSVSPCVDEAEKFVENQILIQIKPGVDENSFFEKYGLVPRRKSHYGNFWTVEYNGNFELKNVIEVLKHDPLVIYAHPNVKWTLMKENILWVPDDPLLSYQWHFPKIELFDAWDIEQGGSPVIIIGLLDTGTAYEDYPVPSYEQNEIDSTTTMYKKAPDFNLANFIPGYDFVHNDLHPNDDHGHGTHVAGTLIESTNNGIGVAGIAFNTTLMPIKVMNSIGFGRTDWVTDGIYYAVTHGCDIINMSIAASSDPGPAFYSAVQFAYSNGVIMTAGAGNSAYAQPAYPAYYQEVIAVGATNSADSLAFYSNYGDTIDVVAPGGDLVDRDNNGFPDLVVQQTIGMREIGFPKPKPDTFFYVGMGGTSMAAPHTTGVIALMLSYGIPKENIRKILRTNSLDLGAVGYDTIYGFGRISAFSCLGANDTIGPSIINTTQWSDTNFTGPFPVWSEIFDLFGISKKFLFYRFNSLPWDSLPAIDSLFNKFLFLIPSALPGTFVRYYIKAKDITGNISFDPPGAPSVSYGFIVRGTGIKEDYGKKNIYYRIYAKRNSVIIESFKPLKFSIFDCLGRVIKEFSSMGKEKIKIEILSPGVYFLKTEKGESKKIIFFP